MVNETKPSIPVKSFIFFLATVKDPGIERSQIESGEAEQGKGRVDDADNGDDRKDDVAFTPPTIVKTDFGHIGRLKGSRR